MVFGPILETQWNVIKYFNSFISYIYIYMLLTYIYMCVCVSNFFQIYKLFGLTKLTWYFKTFKTIRTYNYNTGETNFVNCMEALT